MEITIELTHLLNEETEFTQDVNKLFEMNPDWDYAFNVHDSGLDLQITQG